MVSRKGSGAETSQGVIFSLLPLVRSGLLSSAVVGVNNYQGEKLGL